MIIGTNTIDRVIADTGNCKYYSDNQVTNELYVECALQWTIFSVGEEVFLIRSAGYLQSNKYTSWSLIAVKGKQNNNNHTEQTTGHIYAWTFYPYGLFLKTTV